MLGQLLALLALAGAPLASGAPTLGSPEEQSFAADLACSFKMLEWAQPTAAALPEDVAKFVHSLGLDLRAYYSLNSDQVYGEEVKFDGLEADELPSGCSWVREQVDRMRRELPCAARLNLKRRPQILESALNVRSFVQVNSAALVCEPRAQRLARCLAVADEQLATLSLPMSFVGHLQRNAHFNWPDLLLKGSGSLEAPGLAEAERRASFTRADCSLLSAQLNRATELYECSNDFVFEFGHLADPERLRYGPFLSLLASVQLCQTLDLY